MTPAARTGIAAAAVGAAALASMAGLDSWGRSRRTLTGPVAPFSSARQLLIDRPRDAVRVWREAGARGRIVVAVTARWNRIVIGLFGPTARDSHYPVTVSNMASDRAALLDSANFLYVASLDGIAREVIAVLPEDRYRERLPAGHDGMSLPASITSTFEGFPRSFTTLSRLALPAEPSLLYVAASAFEEPLTDELEAALERAGLRTDLALFCLELGDDRVSDAARTRLLAAAGRQPGRWRPLAGTGSQGP